MDIEDSQRLNDRDDTPLQRLRAQLLGRWEHFPSEWSDVLDLELTAALERASASQSEVITVMNPTSRPLHLRLAALVSDAGLDIMYKQEWAEFSVSDHGRCYLVYRRRAGEDYAIEWSPTTTMPASMLSLLSEPLARAILGGDGDDDD